MTPHDVINWAVAALFSTVTVVVAAFAVWFMWRSIIDGEWGKKE